MCFQAPSAKSKWLAVGQNDAWNICMCTHAWSVSTYCYLTCHTLNSKTRKENCRQNIEKEKVTKLTTERLVKGLWCCKVWPLPDGITGGICSIWRCNIACMKIQIITNKPESLSTLNFKQTSFTTSCKESSYLNTGNQLGSCFKQQVT